MNRRDVIKSLGLVSLHALYPSVLNAFQVTSKTGGERSNVAFFSSQELMLVKEVIDIILPATKTKSASEVGVHFFLDDVFAACLTSEQKELIKDGLSSLHDTWKNTNNKINSIQALDREAYTGSDRAAWFKTFKQFTLVGFFTSEEGTTRAGEYQKFPDQYVGEIKADDQTLAHGKTSLRYSF